MKKILSLLILLFSLTMFAQERGERRSNMSDEEMATLGAKRLAMQLDLNEEQEIKLKELYTKRIEDRRELIEERREERSEIKKEAGKERAKMKEVRGEQMEKFKVQMQEILTEEQFEKWEQLQEKRRKGRQPIMKDGKN